MTVVLAVGGSLKTKAVNLTTTGPIAIATANQEIGFRLESLCAATDGTATAFSLWMQKDANLVYLVNGDTVAANKSIIINHPVVLENGWALMCSAGTANHISVTATLAMLTKTDQS